MNPWNSHLPLLLAAMIVSAPCGPVAAADSEPGKSPIGNWKIISMDFCGKNELKFKDGTFNIAENGASESLTTAGERSQFKLKTEVYDARKFWFRLTIETSEDALSAGGAGPRKGLCRITDKGELEIIETTSAIDEYPKDFSDATKKENKFWKLKPSNSNE